MRLPRPSARLRWPGLLFAATLAFAVAGCDTAGEDPGPDPVTSPALASAWQDLVVDLVREEYLYPPPAARLYAYAGLMVYEGLVHGYPGYRSLAGQLNGLALPPPDPGAVYDWYTVASAAERAILTALFEDAADATYARIDALAESQLASRRAAGVAESVLARSVAYGERLAAALDAWCRTDGFADTRGRPYTPPTGDGMWVPTPPLHEAALEPHWGALRPLVLTSTAECDVVGDPPAYSLDPGSPFWRDLQEVYAVSKTLTEEQRAIALYWADDPGLTGAPPGHWITIARQLNDQLDLTLIEAAETYALVGVGLHDAFLSAWRTKYRTNYLRPVTAVQRLIDPTWLPIVETPPFPEFTSGHSTGSGSMIEVLGHLHGPATGFTDAAHVGRGMPARTYASFEEAGLEASFSRLYGGIHFRTAKEKGVEQGRCVGALVTARVRTRR